MMKRLIAIVFITGACSAYPHQDESNIVPLPEASINPKKGVFNPDYPETELYNPEKVDVEPERGAFNPEKGPVDPETVTDDPEKGPSPVPNVPGADSKDIPVPQEGPKPESDLKTDATFWWPFYRSSWGYPTYRSYSWGYPHYRYYRPRTYYSYYYW